MSTREARTNRIGVRFENFSRSSIKRLVERFGPTDRNKRRTDNGRKRKMTIDDRFLKVNTQDIRS